MFESLNENLGKTRQCEYLSLSVMLMRKQMKSILGRLEAFSSGSGKVLVVRLCNQKQ